MKAWIQINNKDNVVIALQHLSKGTEIRLSDHSFSLLQDVDKGHKVATGVIVQGQALIKYGEAFGYATQLIEPGEWVHTHNVKTTLNETLEYTYQPEPVSALKVGHNPDIQLYRRASGKVGIRNELWIIPTVGCVNGIAQQIARAFQDENVLDDIDGIHVFPHQFGCSQLGADHQTTKQLLQSMATHPNAGGVLVVGLGCENNQITPFKESLGEHDSKRIRFMVAQDSEDEIEEGLRFLSELYSEMKNDKREKGKLSEIIFGLECGGSDGLSGITANPLLGAFSDSVIANGGTTVLTEVPEMFGAETLLMSRARNKRVFNDIVRMINGFKQYYNSHNLPVYENPSPGNKAGGITTLEDKSLGCTQKAGTSQVVDVVEYTHQVKRQGLNLLNAPGNDAIATSGLAAAGCHIVLFTTGRGTPYGGFVPTIKIATNSGLAIKKPRWIDFDAGKLVSTDISMDELLSEFINKVVDIVNGEYCKNEHNDIRELAIWKNGVTL
ncbi:altronate dehydratase family protein [Grimontia hollisae]|uniref:UxaA family hydrolase n=1 Tax=Grimontia hollisae TaxID=673 RepID=UPI0023DC5065|nr:altronate dehydratase family protein [Grimontia hollisae]MDF2183987.1 altronate dehydratase family protein [Grimontia hollisae]